MNCVCRWLSCAHTCAPAASAARAPESSAASTAASTAARDSFYVAKARADSVRRPYNEADVRFMSNMIGHHAQAIYMSRMAPTHGASAAVRTLADRIINAQQDEIAIMQTWLRDRRKPVPEPAHSAGMPGMENMHHPESSSGQAMLMPGMLSDEQLRELGW